MPRVQAHTHTLWSQGQLLLSPSLYYKASALHSTWPGCGIMEVVSFLQSVCSLLQERYWGWKVPASCSQLMTTL